MVSDWTEKIYNHYNFVNMPMQIRLASYTRFYPRTLLSVRYLEMIIATIVFQLHIRKKTHKPIVVPLTNTNVKLPVRSTSSASNSYIGYFIIIYVPMTIAIDSFAVRFSSHISKVLVKYFRGFV
jgi:hypothetical protein|uniref:Uncharacterized protein n=1 Tax=Sipha flava TaxID=143950 RepID=A0A2S2R4X5_9HEMI